MREAIASPHSNPSQLGHRFITSGLSGDLFMRLVNTPPGSEARLPVAMRHQRGDLTATLLVIRTRKGFGLRVDTIALNGHDVMFQPSDVLALTADWDCDGVRFSAFVPNIRVQATLSIALSKLGALAAAFGQCAPIDARAPLSYAEKAEIAIKVAEPTSRQERPPRDRTERTLHAGTRTARRG
jgi:hypothetical protein